MRVRSLERGYFVLFLFVSCLFFSFSFGQPATGVLVNVRLCFRVLAMRQIVSLVTFARSLSKNFGNLGGAVSAGMTSSIRHTTKR